MNHLYSKNIWKSKCFLPKRHRPHITPIVVSNLLYTPQWNNERSRSKCKTSQTTNSNSDCSTSHHPRTSRPNFIQSAQEEKSAGWCTIWSRRELHQSFQLWLKSIRAVLPHICPFPLPRSTLHCGTCRWFIFLCCLSVGRPSVSLVHVLFCSFSPSLP